MTNGGRGCQTLLLCGRVRSRVWGQAAYWSDVETGRPVFWGTGRSKFRRSTGNGGTRCLRLRRQRRAGPGWGAAPSPRTRPGHPPPRFGPPPLPAPVRFSARPQGRGKPDYRRGRPLILPERAGSGAAPPQRPTEPALRPGEAGEAPAAPRRSGAPLGLAWA